MIIETDTHEENIFFFLFTHPLWYLVKNRMDWLYGVWMDVAATAAGIFGAPDPRPRQTPARASVGVPSTGMGAQEKRIRDEIDARAMRIPMLETEVSRLQQAYEEVLRGLCGKKLLPAQKTSLEGKGRTLKRTIETKQRLIQQLSDHIAMMENALVAMEAGLSNRSMQNSILGVSGVLGPEKDADAMRDAFSKASDTINERIAEDTAAMAEASQFMFPEAEEGDDTLAGDIAAMQALISEEDIVRQPESPTLSTSAFPSVPGHSPAIQQPTNHAHAASETRNLLRAARAVQK